MCTQQQNHTCPKFNGKSQIHNIIEFCLFKWLKRSHYYCDDAILLRFPFPWSFLFFFSIERINNLDQFHNVSLAGHTGHKVTAFFLTGISFWSFPHHCQHSQQYRCLLHTRVCMRQQICQSSPNVFSIDYSLGEKAFSYEATWVDIAIMRHRDSPWKLTIRIASLFFNTITSYSQGKMDPYKTDVIHNNKT